MSLTLSGGTVVVSLAPLAVVEGDVVLEGDRVTAVGTAQPSGTVVDCSGSLVIPGNACAHTHLYSALARGMPFRLEPPANFVEILQRVWWRLDRALDEGSIRASALVEMVHARMRPSRRSCTGHSPQEAFNWIMFSHNHHRDKSGKRPGKAPFALLTGTP